VATIHGMSSPCIRRRCTQRSEACLSLVPCGSECIRILLLFLGRFLCPTPTMVSIKERNKRHSIYQPPGRKRAEQLTTHLPLNTWIHSSPSSLPLPPPSPSRCQSPPYPSIKAEVPAAATTEVASSFKRPSIILSDSALHNPHHRQVFSASCLLHPCLSMRVFPCSKHSSPVFMTSLFSTMFRPSLSRAGAMNHLFDTGIWRPTAASFY
jgi:hypothetical protein